MRSKALPSAITSYDLLKTFAVILMAVDHVGLYFFPDDLWWRAVGRMSFPIWFFLIGYANSRDLSLKLWLCAAGLIAANVMVGTPVFALNALVTIILVRLFLDKVMVVALQNEMQIWRISVLFLFLAIPTGMLTEYGTIGLVAAMFGYMVRRRGEIKSPEIITRFLLFLVVAYALSQQMFFGFSSVQFLAVTISSALVFVVLSCFKSTSYAALTRYVTLFGRWFVQLCGRRTLEIYVLHLVVFKAIAVLYGFEGYEFLNFSWFGEPSQ